MKPTRTDVVRTARSLVGVRFLHQGRNPAIGLDCVGIVVATSELLGLWCYDFARYTRRPHPDLALEHARKGLDEIPCTDAGPGAVVLCKIALNGQGQHFVIVTDDDQIVHAMERYKQVVEVPNAGMRERLAVAAFHFRGVDY